MTPRFLVGIDLGTSNCALAYADLESADPARVHDLPIPQLRAPGQLASSDILPSCLYLPVAGEFAADALSLPWEAAPTRIVGEFARAHGAKVPGRLVASAKSWLCHPAVDRTAPILPWGAPPDVPRISPVEASATCLRHLARAWDAVHPDHPLAKQEIVVAVPASFDAVARELTVTATREAGLPHGSLVEEPQAAFESFVASTARGGCLTEALRDVGLVLVVDVGGGTTDFTLVRVEPGPDGPEFRRLAVGDHLMLGGDNMDAALARCAEDRLATAGKRLPADLWTQLVQACREAKETLLGPAAPDEVAVAVARRGSALLGSTLGTRLSRADLDRLLLDGFLPACDATSVPARGKRAALQELGLPYAQDPAITRQLAAFLSAHRQTAGAASGSGTRVAGVAPSLPRPDAVLFNGGVFKAGLLSERLLAVLSAWWPDQPPVRRLAPDSLDLAVARGAVCHGLARRGWARRITGGSSHAYFIGLERQPGAPPSALCVVPRGLEEGRTTGLGGRTFRLQLGRPVQFPLYATAADRPEATGDVVPLDDDLVPLPPLHALLPDPQGAAGSRPVQLQATLTPLGTLEVWAVAPDSPERWRLEFQLRAGPAEDAAPRAVESVGLPTSVRSLIEGVFPPPGSRAAAQPARSMSAQLERLLGPRQDWPLALLRELWAVAWAGAVRRRKSADHERAFFQLAGFTLRPGFGAPLDDWRCEQMAGLFAEGIQFTREAPVWIEFWVAWRRIAGGLSPRRHLEIWGALQPHLSPRLNPAHARHLPRPKGPQPEGLHEMVRLAAALEHLPGADKTELGDWIAAQLAAPTPTPGPWPWALGRLGARVPLYGSTHQVVPPDVAVRWLELLWGPRVATLDGAPFALAQLARLSGDRVRDLEPAARERVAEWLARSGAPESWVRMTREIVALERADESRALGDSLPLGLAT